MSFLRTALLWLSPTASQRVPGFESRQRRERNLMFLITRSRFLASPRLPPACRTASRSGGQVRGGVGVAYIEELMKEYKKISDIDSGLKSLGMLASRLKRQGKYKEAEEKFAQILKIDPDDVFALVGIGDLKRKRKQFEEAVDYYNNALKIEEKNKYALLGLGDAYRGLRELDKGLKVWLKYLSLHPDDYGVMTRVADSFRKKGDLEKAKKYYVMALKINTDDQFALMGLGSIYLQGGQDEKGLEYFEKLIRASNDCVLALTSAANIYRRRRQFEKAIDYYNKVLEINPRDSYAWHGKADCLRGLKDYPSAIKAWELAMKHGMDPRIAITRIGDGYLYLKDLEKAEANYEKALTIGYDKFAHIGMARISTRRNHVKKALEILTMLVEKEPDDWRVAAEFRDFIRKHPRVARDVKGAEVMV